MANLNTSLELITVVPVTMATDQSIDDIPLLLAHSIHVVDLGAWVSTVMG